MTLCSAITPCVINAQMRPWVHVEALFLDKTLPFVHASDAYGGYFFLSPACQVYLTRCPARRVKAPISVWSHGQFIEEHTVLTSVHRHCKECYEQLASQATTLRKGSTSNIHLYSGMLAQSTAISQQGETMSLFLFHRINGFDKLSRPDKSKGHSAICS